MKRDYVQVKVSIDSKLYNHLLSIAKLYNWSLSETIRRFLERNIDLNNLK